MSSKEIDKYCSATFKCPRPLLAYYNIEELKMGTLDYLQIENTKNDSNNVTRGEPQQILGNTMNNNSRIKKYNGQLEFQIGLFCGKFTAIYKIFKKKLLKF